MSDGNIGTLVRHRGLALPYLIWLSAVGAETLLTVRGSNNEEGSGMALVDDRGQVFGRFNPVDVFVFVLVVVMIPVAYGAYALFRTPPAKLTSIEPNQFTVGPNLRVRVNGTNLRPFMRVSFNTVQGRTFMIGSTGTADVDLPDLDPGTYDIVLYDYAQEVDRLSKALTILPRAAPPTLTVSVQGAFVGLNQAQVDALRPDATFVQGNRVLGKVLAAGARQAGALQMRTGATAIAVGLPGLYDVPAVLELECSLESSSGDGSLRCTFHGPAQPAALIADAIVSLPAAGGTVSFQVSDVHPAGSPRFVRLRVHTTMAPDMARQIRTGDADANIPDYPGAWIGRVESVNGAEVVLRVPAQQLANGWTYRGQWLKAGGAIRFETSAAVIGGTIADLTPIDNR